MLQADEASRPKQIRSLALDVVTMAAVYFAAFALFWVGPSTLSEMVNEPARLFAHPFWRLIEWGVSETTSSAVTHVVNWAIRLLMMAVTVVVFGWAALRTMNLFKWPSDNYSSDGATSKYATIQHLLFTIMIIELVLSLVPANAHPWYQVWSVPYVGFWTIYALPKQRISLVNLYIVLVGAFTIIYHTRIMM